MFRGIIQKATVAAATATATATTGPGCLGNPSVISSGKLLPGTKSICNVNSFHTANWRQDSASTAAQQPQEQHTTRRNHLRPSDDHTELGSIQSDFSKSNDGWIQGNTNQEFASHNASIIAEKTSLDGLKTEIQDHVHQFDGGLNRNSKPDDDSSCASTNKAASKNETMPISFTEFTYLKKGRRLNAAATVDVLHSDCLTDVEAQTSLATDIPTLTDTSSIVGEILADKERAESLLDHITLEDSRAYNGQVPAINLVQAESADIVDSSSSNQVYSDPESKVSQRKRIQKMKVLQDLLGYDFKHSDWLSWAISRNDARHEGQRIPSIQKYLAIIGDSILKSTYYAHNFPFQMFHKLHVPFEKISSNNALAGIMYDSGLLHVVCPSPGSGYINNTLTGWDIATIFEAIIGAVHMDSQKNYDATKSVIETVLKLAGMSTENGSPLDPTNCIKRQTSSPVNYDFSMPFPNRNKHLKLKIILELQSEFITLREERARLLSEEAPQVSASMQMFRDCMYGGGDLQKLVEDQRMFVERLGRDESTKEVITQPLSEDLDHESLSNNLSKDVNLELHQNSEDESLITSSRLKFLDHYKATMETSEEFQIRRRLTEKTLGYSFMDVDLLRMTTSCENATFNGRNVPNAQDHLAHLGDNVLRLVFYQHNLSYGTYGTEMHHAFVAISSTSNLALICEDIGLAKAAFPGIKPQGLRPDLKNPYPYGKYLAITLQAMIGAIWVDSESNYPTMKSVIERILQQEGDEGQAGSPLDWQRTVGRPNTWWPRALRRDSPLRDMIAQNDEIFGEVQWKHQFKGMALPDVSPDTTEQQVSDSAEKNPSFSK